MAQLEAVNNWINFQRRFLSNLFSCNISGCWINLSRMVAFVESRPNLLIVSPLTLSGGNIFRLSWTLFICCRNFENENVAEYLFYIFWFSIWKGYNCWDVGEIVTRSLEFGWWDKFVWYWPHEQWQFAHSASYSLSG